MTRPARPIELLALAALGLLSGSGWLLTSIWPQPAPLALAAAVHFAVIALVGGVCLVRRTGPLPSLSQSIRLAVASLCLFALPTLLLDRSSAAVSELATVALFAGVPVLTALWSALLGDTLAISATLAPGLLGWWGALLLFPLALPASPRQAGLFALAVCAAISFAGAGLWLHRLMRGIPLAVVLIVAGLANAVGFALAAWFSGSVSSEALRQAPPELLRALLFDLPLVALTLWLLRETSALRVASRTLLGPALTVIEGYLLLRERPPLLTLAAVAMLLAAALWLIVPSRDQEALPPSLFADPAHPDPAHPDPPADPAKQ